MYDVTALGELLIDFTDSGTSPAGQKVFERNPGGTPANVLVALQRLGHSTAFVGKVGCDMHGAFLRQTLEENDVDCSGLASDPDYFTTLAFVALDPTGERTFSFARKPGADTQLRADEPNRDVLQNTRGLHVGSLSLTDEPARSATLEAARKILEQGPKVVVVTLDADGAMVVTSKGARMVPSFRVDATDTTGAGDSFWGGFLCALLDSGKDVSTLTLDDATSFARFGNAVASLCVRERGAIPAMPSRDAVEEVLAANA